MSKGFNMKKYSRVFCMLIPFFFCTITPLSDPAEGD